MKKLIMIIMCAVMSLGLFAVEDNPVQELYDQYSEIIALSKDKSLSKSERAEYVAQANAVLSEAKFYGILAKNVAVGSVKGIEVPPSKWVELYTSSTEGNAVTDVYDFKFSLKWPYVNNGIRVYKSSSFTGYLVFEYAEENGVPSRCYAVVKNGNTKGIHFIEFGGDSFYVLLGKPTKTLQYSVPSLFLEGYDMNSVLATKTEVHELFKKITFSGYGSLSTKKLTTREISYCGCGVGSTVTTTCTKMTSANGYVTGIMDCECPEDENWVHTVFASYCAPFFENGTSVVRTHEASMCGSWKISYNSKLSTVRVND